MKILNLSKLYMYTVIQYTAKAVLGVDWLNRERDMLMGMYQSMFGGCPHHVPELCQFCSVVCARLYVLYCDWANCLFL